MIDVQRDGHDEMRQLVRCLREEQQMVHVHGIARKEELLRGVVTEDFCEIPLFCGEPHCVDLHAVDGTPKCQ